MRLAATVQGFLLLVASALGPMFQNPDEGDSQTGALIFEKRDI